VFRRYAMMSYAMMRPPSSAEQEHERERADEEHGGDPEGVAEGHHRRLGADGAVDDLEREVARGLGGADLGVRGAGLGAGLIDQRVDVARLGNYLCIILDAAATAPFEVLSATMDTPHDDDAQQPKRRTGEHAARIGGRSERVVRDVLAAAAQELSRCGYAALRMEDVAGAAGVNKTTVYRRWPTKLELVRATLRSLNETPSAAPDLGSIRADLRSLIDGFVARMNSTEKRCIARMISAEMDQPEVQELVRALRAEHLIPWQAVITRSIERGELPARSDARLIVDVVLGTVMSGVLRFQAEREPGYLEAVVDLVVAGAKCGGAVRGGDLPGGAAADVKR